MEKSRDNMCAGPSRIKRNWLSRKEEGEGVLRRDNSVTKGSECLFVFLLKITREVRTSLGMLVSHISVSGLDYWSRLVTPVSY